MYAHNFPNTIKTVSKMDKELLAQLRGEYSTSFYRIFMDGKYDQNLSRMSPKDMGTFVHEYIHYMQNISTLWGMYESLIRYQCIAEAKEELERINDIPLLYKFNFSETLRKRLHVLKIGLGEECFDSYSNKRIELDKGIDISKELENYNGKEFEKYYLECYVNGGKNKVHIGAKIIKESMASMYQRLFDADAVSPHDIPYNVIELIAKAYYPNIAEDKFKLISICHISLFDMTPASLLFKELKTANDSPNIDGKILFDQFVNNSNIKLKDDSRIGIVDFYKKMSRGLIDSISKCMGVKAQYMEQVIERANLSTGFVPVITILYGRKEPLSFQHFQTLIDYLGVPYLETTEGQVVVPGLQEDEKNKNANEVLCLMLHSLVFEYFTQKQPYNACPLFHKVCKGISSEKVYETCIGAPWMNNLSECRFALACDFLKLRNKKIYWKS